MTSFVQRAIDVQFTKATGTFTESGKNTVTLSGLRVSATIEKGGPASFNTADIRVYGMTQSSMNDLATLGKIVPVENTNAVSIFAGTAGTALSLAFSGSVNQAWGDYREQPEVALQVIALTGVSGALQAIEPSSFSGPTDVVVILQRLAKQLGLNFQNNGVSGVRLSSPYLPGSALQQARDAAEHAGIYLTIDDGTMAIWPAAGARQGATPLVSPQTGLVGYPTFTQFGIDLRVLYNPAIVYGAQIKVESSLKPACGLWGVYKLTHHLDSITPGGSWFTDLKTTSPGTSPPVT